MKYVYIAALSLAVQSLAAQTARNASMNYNDYPVYSGKDLGLTYTPDSSTFRVYAPSAKSMRLLLYQAGEGGEPLDVPGLRVRSHHVRLTGEEEDAIRAQLAGLGYLRE